MNEMNDVYLEKSNLRKFSYDNSTLTQLYYRLSQNVCLNPHHRSLNSLVADLGADFTGTTDIWTPQTQSWSMGTCFIATAWGFYRTPHGPLQV
jgi:hypothetical protein